MSRAAALATLAAATLRQGSLLEYEPGALLVVDHRILDRDLIRVASPPMIYQFEAHSFTGTGIHHGIPAWGYYADDQADR